MQHIRTSQIQAVRPNTKVDGFNVTVERYEHSIVADPSYEDLVIDYHFEVMVTCDGTNPAFPQADWFSVYISQLITDCAMEFVAEYPLLILQPYETITSIDVQHTKVGNNQGVWLQIWVRNQKDAGFYAYSYLLRETV